MHLYRHGTGTTLSDDDGDRLIAPFNTISLLYKLLNPIILKKELKK